MATSLSPTAWSRWLALELRRLREQAGLSQKEVANALRCNVSKVSYIENAQRPVIPRDLNEVLLPLYHVAEDRWPLYMQAARDARQPRWWEKYREGGALPSEADLYVGLEQGSSRVRWYGPQYVPGPLQTLDYASAVMRRVAKMDDETIGLAVELRMRRQEAFQRQADPIKLWAVLDEAALRRVVGGNEVMAGQLERLLLAAAQPNVTLQLIPFSVGAHHGMASGFSLLEFSWESAIDPGIVHLENALGGQYVDGHDEVRVYTDVFEQLCALALGPDSTVDLLTTAMEEYRQS